MDIGFNPEINYLITKVSTRKYRNHTRKAVREGQIEVNRTREKNLS